MFCIYAYELFEEMSKQAAYVLFEEMYKQAAGTRYLPFSVVLSSFLFN
jgi:hypothetical protein